MTSLGACRSLMSVSLRVGASDFRAYDPGSPFHIIDAEAFRLFFFPFYSYMLSSQFGDVSVLHGLTVEKSLKMSFSATKLSPNSSLF